MRESWGALPDSPPPRPTLFRGAARSWPASSRWSAPFFAQHHGDQPVRCNRARSNQEVVLDLRSYLSRSGEDEPDPLMLHWRIPPDDPALSLDYAVPPSWRGWLFHLDSQLHPGWFWIIFGPGGAGLPEHEDMLGTATWNALIQGKKRWTLHDQTTVSFVQEAGDVIFLPSRVRHSVEYLSSSISLSENIVDSSCAGAVHSGLIARDEQRMARIVDGLSRLHAQGRLS
jgi:hypothetical protein